MKKALVLMSVCLLVQPLSSYATTTGKKSHKKHHHRLAKADMKQEAPMVAKDTVPAAPASDQPTGGMSGSLDFVTNYVFRGISQSENLPAAQGGLTYTFPIGIYLNLWGSNVKFPDGKGATVELDTIVGWQGSVTDDFSYNVSLDRYNYPGAQSSNYNEAIALLTYRFFQLGLGYSGNVYATHKTGIYYSGTLTFDIPSHYVYFDGVSVAAEMGHYSLPRAAGNSYDDYSFTVNKKMNSTYTITAQWTATNGRNHYPPYDSNQFIGQVAASF